MNNSRLERINWIFLGKECKYLGLDKGYLQYIFNIRNTETAVLITIEEEAFKLKFVSYVTPDKSMWMVIEGTEEQEIKIDSYLSREIHRFL